VARATRAKLGSDPAKWPIRATVGWIAETRAGRKPAPVGAFHRHIRLRRMDVWPAAGHGRSRFDRTWLPMRGSTARPDETSAPVDRTVPDVTTSTLAAKPSAPGLTSHPGKSYAIVKKLGQGGMAEVLLVSRALPGQPAQLFALKRILPELSSRADFVRMFEREASIAARCDHPNIPRVFESVQRDDERYLVMEYVHGRSLRTLGEAAATRGGLGLAAAITVVRDVALALAHLHALTDERGEALGLIHRDVSPGNVLVGRDGNVKLLDFGIAKATLGLCPINSAPIAIRGTLFGGPMKGNAGYMSPEQCQCEPLDRRSDIYSLGALLYEVTVGRRLFRVEEGLETIRDIVWGNIERPTQVSPSFPRALERILLRALALRPDDRFATAREFARALERFAAKRRLSLSPDVVAAEVARLAPVRPLDPRVGVPWTAERPVVRHRWAPRLPAIGWQDAAAPILGASLATLLILFAGTPGTAPTSVASNGSTPALADRRAESGHPQDRIARSYPVVDLPVDPHPSHRSSLTTGRTARDLASKPRKSRSRSRTKSPASAESPARKPSMPTRERAAPSKGKFYLDRPPTASPTIEPVPEFSLPRERSDRALASRSRFTTSDPGRPHRRWTNAIAYR